MTCFNSFGFLSVERGVKEEQLPAFGKSLLKTIRDVLGSDFTLEASGAWDWLWTWLSQVFLLSLEEAVSLDLSLLYNILRTDDILASALDVHAPMLKQILCRQ